MEEVEETKRNPLGCAVVAIAVVGAILGLAWYLNRADEAAKTGCQRYAETVATALDNCHSGVNRNHGHHIAICERSIDPSDACLERIQALSCDELERGVPASAGEICRKE
jgi:hypothetical protein